jgi:hypothetical protein
MDEMLVASEAYTAKIDRAAAEAAAIVAQEAADAAATAAKIQKVRGS